MSENVSLVMITRNSEKTIERCLRSVFERESPIASEAVVVLGGQSTDRTEEILAKLAQEFPIRVEPLPPELAAKAFDEDGHIMDFSVVRNYAHSLARNLWHFWLDSVTGETPVVVRKIGSDFFDYVEIRDLVPAADRGVHSCTKDGGTLEVLTHQGWKRLRGIKQHKVAKPVYRIVDALGDVRVTEDHSLFSGGKEIAGKDVRAATDATPGTILDHADGCFGQQVETITTALAEAWGFFAAEGSAFVKSEESKAAGKQGPYYQWAVSNTQRVLLERYAAVFSAAHTRRFYFVLDDNERPNCAPVWKLCAADPKDITLAYREKFYSSAGRKKVPTEILNGTAEIMAAFLRGWELGDGHVRRTSAAGKELQSFSCNSPILAAGLLYLYRLLGRSFWLHTPRPDKPTIVSASERAANGWRKSALTEADIAGMREMQLAGATLREIGDAAGIDASYAGKILRGDRAGLLSPADSAPGDVARRIEGVRASVRDAEFADYVYDLSTEAGTFVGGVGDFVLHNSDDVAVSPERAKQVLAATGADGGETPGEAKSMGELLAEMPPEINIVWIPYHYLIEPTTDRVLVAQRRERILRWRDGFTWADPIHECIVPTGANKYTAQNSAYFTGFWIEHRPDRSDAVREARNFRVLQKMHHLAESRWRVAYYLADHYSAAGEFEQARHFFNLAAKLAFNPEEKYLTHHNIFRMCWRAGWGNEALAAATHLLALNGDRAEGLADMVLYFSLFEKDPVRCAYWYEKFEASLAKTPNALSMWAAEVKILPHLIAIEAFASLSRHGDARRAALAALDFEPRHPDAKRWLGLLDRMEARERAAQDAVKLLDYCEAIGAREEAVEVADNLPATLREQRPIREARDRIAGHTMALVNLTLVPEDERPSWVPDGVPCLRACGDGEGFPVAEWTHRLSGEPRIAFDDVWDRLRLPLMLEHFNAQLLIGTAREGLWDADKRARVSTPESQIRDLDQLGNLDYLKLVYPTPERPTIVSWVDTVSPPRVGSEIVVYAPASVEDWGPESPATTGIGASESQIVELVRRLSKRGCRVTVYGAIQVPEVESGVVWRNVKDFDHRRACDLLIAHRAPWLAHRTDIGADKFYVWLHDQPESFSIAAFFPKTQSRVTRYICLTKTQAGGYGGFHHLGIKEPLIPYFLPACDLEPMGAPASDHSACYLSAPYRGLEWLLMLWPQVRERVPDAVLRVAYGWQVFDSIATIEGAAMREKRAQMEQMLKQPGVEWLGRINERAVREVLDHSRVWAYPCTYPEMLCHVGQRAQARGAWPVVRPYAALAETVADGTFVHSDPSDPAARSEFAAAVATELLRPVGEFAERRQANRESALAWHKAAEEGWQRALTEDGLIG